MTRISATAPDVLFLVDQQVVTGTGMFAWPAGSKHTLRIDSVVFSPLLFQTRYVFKSWNSSAGQLSNPSNEVVVTADRHIAWYNADLQMQYDLKLSFYPCEDRSCQSPGTVWVNGSRYPGNADIWVDAGATVRLEAVPNPGYIFAGWSQGPDTLAPLYSIVMSAPVTVYPHFTTARRIQLTTSPPGLQLLADRAAVLTPTTMEWGWNTTHALGVVSPQRDRYGVAWVFGSWSDGGAREHAYQVGAMMTPDSLEARYVREVQTAVMSNPSGLTVTVDGAGVKTPKIFDWGAGETHTLTAPAHATDAAGAPWIFREWSLGTASTQTVHLTEDQAEGGTRVTATYDPLSRIVVESIPPAVTLMVDGVACRAPCDVERNVGATVRLSAPASIAEGDGIRYEFESWDGGADGSVVASAGFRKITARYNTWYRLTLTSQPSSSGSWQTVPAASGGFFPSGTSVAVSFTAADGMRFLGWELDMDGAANPAILVMNSPHALRALVQPLPPGPPPVHVLNAASNAASVAPGSIASLFGNDLAESTVSSTSEILPQSLGGISLLCAERLLPLLYVSPGQVNFQMASNIEPGRYQLELHRDGGLVRKAEVTIVRNAPGLFAAFHRDGSAISEEEPADLGEEVLLYGTGFGPYVVTPLDGIRIPALPADLLVDRLEVRMAGRVVEPAFAGAAPGLVGIALVRVRVPIDLEPGRVLNVTVAVGETESNSVAVLLRRG